MISVLLAFAAAPRTRVSCVGDFAGAYVGPLQARLGRDFDVRAFARSGVLLGAERTTDAALVNAFEPKIVVVVLGAADAEPAFWRKRASEFVPTYRALIDDLSRISSRPTVFVAAPPGESATSAEWGANLADEVGPLVRQVARESEVHWIDLRGRLGDAASTAFDRGRLTALGAEDVADALYDAISSAAQVRSGWKTIADGRGLVVDMGSPRWIGGVRLRSATIGRQVRLALSIDGRRWRDAILDARQRLPSPQYARYLRLSETSGGPAPTLADVDVLPPPARNSVANRRTD